MKTYWPKIRACDSEKTGSDQGWIQQQISGGGCSVTATKFYSRDEILLTQAVDLNILRTVFLVKSSK